MLQMQSLPRLCLCVALCLPCATGVRDSMKTYMKQMHDDTISRLKTVQGQYRFEPPDKQRYQGQARFMRKVDDQLLFALVQHKLGQIAFYVRMFREYAVSADGGGPARFASAFPVKYARDFAPAFDQCNTVATAGGRVAITALLCIEAVYGWVQRMPWFSVDFYADQSKVTGARGVGNGLERTTTKDEYDAFVRSDKNYEDTLTAMYYLCWMSRLMLPPFQYVPYCSINVTNGFSWPERFAPVYTVKSKRILDIVEAAQSAEQNATDYECALASFCPDPCCGGGVAADVQLTFEGIVHEWHIGTIARTCAAAPMSACGARPCYMRMYDNDDFVPMVQGRWNRTCHCDRAPRDVYEARLHSCVDRDECRLGLAECDGRTQHCVNTGAGYVCVCKLGYRWLSEPPIDNLTSAVWHDYKCLPIRVPANATWYGLAVQRQSGGKATCAAKCTVMKAVLAAFSIMCFLTM